MKLKQKGLNAERELIHLFWATKQWTACRVAGSGSMKYPSPDVLAQKGGVSLAIECKTTKSKYQYFDKREIRELQSFAKKSGSRPLVAVRFSRKPWVFMDLAALVETERCFVVSLHNAELRGLTFQNLTKTL